MSKLTECAIIDRKRDPYCRVWALVRQGFVEGLKIIQVVYHPDGQDDMERLCVNQGTLYLTV